MVKLYRMNQWSGGVYDVKEKFAFFVSLFRFVFDLIFVEILDRGTKSVKILLITINSRNNIHRRPGCHYYPYTLLFPVRIIE